MIISLLKHNQIKYNYEQKTIRYNHLKNNYAKDTFERKTKVSFAGTVNNLLFDEIEEHIEDGNLDLVKMLPDLSIINENLNSLLHIAADEKQTKIAAFLLNKGLNVNQKNKRKLTPFAIACSKKDESLIKLFLNFNPDVNTQDKNGNTPLHKSILSEKILGLLLDNGANPYTKNNSGFPVLFEAANNLQTVEFLLQKGVNPNSIDGKERSLLHVAALTNAKNLAQLLLKYKAEINFKDEKGRTPLFYAKRNGIFRLLLKKEANPNIQDKEGKTVLHEMVNNNDIIKVYELLKHKANPNIFDNDHKSPLLYAKNNAMRKLLLKFGADPNVKINNGSSLLHIAVQQNDEEAIKILLEHKANTNIQDKNKQSPLAYAKTNKIRRILLDNEANPNRKMYLHISLITKNSEFFKDLLKANADVNAENSKGRTPLFYCNTPEEIELLIKKEADINHQDENGNTALHIFAANGNAEIVNKLIELKADSSILNKKNESYVDMQDKCKKYECWIKYSEKGFN